MPYYSWISNVSHTVVGNKIVDHSDVVGASPVSAAPPTSSFILDLTPGFNGLGKGNCQTRWEILFGGGLGATYIRDLTVLFFLPYSSAMLHRHQEGHMFTHMWPGDAAWWHSSGSTLAQVMAWCRQATSHYLSQCWPSSTSSYGITRPQWVKLNRAGYSQSMTKIYRT